LLNAVERSLICELIDPQPTINSATKIAKQAVIFIDGGMDKCADCSQTELQNRREFLKNEDRATNRFQPPHRLALYLPTTGLRLFWRPRRSLGLFPGGVCGTAALVI
tara:strand:+ start:159 stop:479 length:321 start_codon:yes stop_codon:yes gene_type:complete